MSLSNLHCLNPAAAPFVPTGMQVCALLPNHVDRCSTPESPGLSSPQQPVHVFHIKPRLPEVQQMVAPRGFHLDFSLLLPGGRGSRGGTSCTEPCLGLRNAVSSNFSPNAKRRDKEKLPMIRSPEVGGPKISKTYFFWPADPNHLLQIRGGELRHPCWKARGRGTLWVGPIWCGFWAMAAVCSPCHASNFILGLVQATASQAYDAWGYPVNLAAMKWG